MVRDNYRNSGRNLTNIKSGSYRAVTTAGKDMISKAFDEDGFIETNYFYLMLLPRAKWKHPELAENDDLYCEYECIDGNHRLTVLVERGMLNQKINFIRLKVRKCDNYRTYLPSTNHTIHSLI